VPEEDIGPTEPGPDRNQDVPGHGLDAAEQRFVHASAMPGQVQSQKTYFPGQMFGQRREDRAEAAGMRDCHQGGDRRIHDCEGALGVVDGAEMMTSNNPTRGVSSTQAKR
jgi:hypothetical protein